jgi:NADPH-dependent curcumin reductase CurA
VIVSAEPSLPVGSWWTGMLGVQQYAVARATYLQVIVNRASMTGFLVLDYEDRYEEAIDELLTWVEEGKLEAREQIVEGGVEDFPDAFLSLFSGANTGKLVLRLK